MRTQRLLLLVPAALLPLAVSFTWTVDALAPKTAAWLLTGAALVLAPGAAPLPWPAAALLGWAALGCLRTPVTFLPLAPWLVGVLLLARARTLADQPGFPARYVRFTSVVAGLVALNGLAQAVWNDLFTSVHIVNPFGSRVLSTLGNPTFFADYLAVHLPLALELGWMATGAAALGWWGCASVQGLAIVLSGSKGGQLAALVAAALWTVSAYRRAGPQGGRTAAAGVALAGFAAAVLLAVPALRAPLERWTSAADRFSFSQRLDMLRGAAALIREAPLRGHGTGQLPVQIPRVQPGSLTRTLGPTLSVNHAHNDWAEVAADLGLFAPMLLLLLLVPAATTLGAAGESGALALSVAAACCAMGTNFFLPLPSSAFFFWVNLGLLCPASSPAWSVRLGLPSRRLARLLALWLALTAGRVLVGTGHYFFGAEAVDRGDGITSVRRLQNAVALMPTNRHPWQYLGRAFEIRGEWPAALDAYRRALALAPWHTITNLNVARIQRQQYLALPLLRHDARDGAIDALLRVIASNPWLTEPRAWGGELCLDAGRMDEAQAFLGTYPPDLAPSAPWHRARARWADQLGNHRAASLEYGKADDLEGREALTRADTALQGGQLAEAERVARDVTRRWPRLSAGWEVLGFTLHTAGKPAEARAAFMRLAQLQPDSITAQVNLATIALNARQPDAAERYLRRALALDPHHPEAHLGLARLRMLQGRRADAVAEYRRTLELAPGHKQATAELARLGGGG